MNVAENVGFGLRMKKVPIDERRRAVADMLRLVSLEGFEERRPSQLSGGQRQRVALARALVNRPSVLLLDEPLGALDLKLRKLMQAELTRIQRQVGITFVYVTHDQEEALAMSDRIAVMDRGRLLQVGSPDEIYARPASREVMEFIGSVNVLEGRVASAEARPRRWSPCAGSGARAGAHPDGLDAGGGGGAARAAGARPRLGDRPAGVERRPARHASRRSRTSASSRTARCSCRAGARLLAFRLNSVDGRGTEPLAERQARVRVVGSGRLATVPLDCLDSGPSARREAAPPSSARRNAMTAFTDRRDFLKQAAVAGAGIGAAALGAWPSPAPRRQAPSTGSPGAATSSRRA